MKTCIVCCETKPLSEFGARRQNRDGFSNRCRECTHTYHKLYRLKHGDALREYDRIRYRKKIGFV